MIFSRYNSIQVALVSATCLVAAIFSIAHGQNESGDTPDGPAQKLIPQSISAEAQAFYERVGTGTVPAQQLSDADTLNKLRAMLGRLFLGFAEQISDQFELTEQNMNGVQVMWVETPAAVRDDKIIMYLHGGGYILGSAKTSLGSAIRITESTGMRIVSVEYRLAPEHPFPAALEDAQAAYRWLLEHGYEGSDIGVYGDSAGGGLALALTLALRDAEIPLPAAVVVLSPLTDLSFTGDTRYTLAQFDPVLRSANDAGRYAMYIGDHEASDPLISPVYADYDNFPPLLIQVGTRERLLSDSVRLARSARSAAAANVTLDVWEGMWHGWQAHPSLPEADVATAEIAQFFLTYLD